MQTEIVLVTGAGGFIGGALVAELRRQGHRKIRAVDIKPLGEWYQSFDDVENLSLDLNLLENCERAARGAYEVYNLAANMGGMGFIENNKALCMLSVLINTHLLMAARKPASSGTSTPPRPASTTPTSSVDPTVPAAQGRGRLSRACPRTATAGRSCSASACAATSARISACTRAWRASTTSTARTAPGKAAARRRRPPSAAR